MTNDLKSTSKTGHRSHFKQNRDDNLLDFYCPFLDFETNKRWHYIDLKIEVKVRIEKHFDRFAFASDGP